MEENTPKKLDFKNIHNFKVISDNHLETILNALGKHPYLIAALICFSTLGVGYLSEEFIQPDSIMAMLGITICLFVWQAIHFLRIKENTVKNKIIIYSIFVVETFFSIFLAGKFKACQAKAIFATMYLIFIILVVYLLLLNNKKFVDKTTSLLLFALGFAMRFGYCLQTGIYVRQNDVFGFGNEAGNSHSGYIEYLLQNHHLPDFDPSTRWQFYHPPLHHTISAIWLGFVDKISPAYYISCEAIQVLPLFYSCVMLIIAYKTLKLFGLKGASLYVPFAFLCFFPYLYQLSGAINNDALSIMFIMMSIYFTIIWVNKPTLWNLIKIAFAIGFGMMSKLSAGLVAPAVAVVFLAMMIKNRKEIVKYIKHYMIFGLICCPLGLWWEIRNLIKYNLPINYVNSLDPDCNQYLGNIPILKRFTDFSSYQFDSLFQKWIEDEYQEFNPTVAIMKNAVFGEGGRPDVFTPDYIYAQQFLFWSCALLSFIGFIFTFVCLFQKKDKCPLFGKILLVLANLTILGNFYVFQITFPFECTMNYRYIVPCTFIGAFATGIVMKNFKEKGTKPARCVNLLLTVMTIIFSVSSVITYLDLITTKIQ